MIRWRTAVIIKDKKVENASNVLVDHSRGLIANFKCKNMTSKAKS